MVASITSPSPSTASNLSGSTALSGQTSAQAQSDRFLKLLVAQLNNQDPMNPMDNAQMTSQMAQINTVSGIQELNDTMKSMATQFAAMQSLQGASMIGHAVLLDGNTLTVDAGVGKAAIDLAGNADNVTVQVKGANGALLDTLQLGAQSAGRHNFEWDASKYQGTGSPTFTVVASQGSQKVAATTLVRDTITSVSTGAAGLGLSLKGGSSVTYDAIRAIL
jgi:flagellar basal-body rod modification protein FlgD